MVAPPEPPRRTPDPAPIPWRLILAVWLLPALADVADVYFSRRLAGPVTPLWRVAAEIVPGWYVWAPLSAAAVRLAGRFPLRRPVRPAAVVAHAGFAIVATAAHALVIATAFWAFDPRATRTWRAELVMTAQDWLPISLVLAAMTLGAAHALLRVRASQAQERRAAALEARLAQAELAVLRAQLEPHFLFNALNTAVSLVRAGDGAAGVDVLTRLGDLLRHLLTGVAQETTLGEELGVVDTYLGIERARFGARLAAHVDVPADLCGARVPSLALQTLVENAVRHGIARRDAAGQLWIAARGDGEVLTLSVRDDGPGVARVDGDAPAGNGTGLRNVRDRLARLYGADAGVALDPVPGGGMEARLWLPRRVGETEGTA